jgi:hypothetical protein
MLTGEDISERFLSNINNYMDRIGSAINVTGITTLIIDLFESKKKDKNQTSATSQLNGNDILEGSNKKRLGAKGANVTKSNSIDPVQETEAKIRYALKQVYKLINIAYDNYWNISCIEDVANNTKNIDLVNDITGLVPAEWRIVLPAINANLMNRAIGQYNAL